MGIERDYEELVISGKVKVIDSDVVKVKELVFLGKEKCSQALLDAKLVGSKGDFKDILVRLHDGFVLYSCGFLAACEIEVDVEYVFLAFCVRYPTLEFDYTILESLRGKCMSESLGAVSYVGWKKIQFYVTMYSSIFEEYASQRGWL